MTAPSQNEVVKRLTDAARGAGWPQGLAQEIGAAAAWMSAQGADGPGLALAALAAKPSAPLAAPTPMADGWGIGPGPVATTAPAALDLLLAGDGPVTLTLTDAPDLLLGFIGHATAQTGTTIALSGRIAAEIANGKLCAAPHLNRDAATLVLTLLDDTTRPDELTPLDLAPSAARPMPRPEVWAQAKSLADRTLVPDSAASRAAGAGPGGIDGAG